MKLTPQEIETTRHKVVMESHNLANSIAFLDELVEAGAQAHADKLSKLTEGELREKIDKIICGAVRYAYCAEKETGCIRGKGNCENTSHWVEQLLTLISPQLLKYKEEIERLKGESELFWQTTNAIKHDLECRHWITEGRGSYAHDDERYRKETGWAFDAIRDLIDKAQKQSKGENYIQQAVQQEREKVKTELSKEALPDSAEYETGEGFKCHKVFFFTRTKWDNFWKALQDNTK